MPERLTLVDRVQELLPYTAEAGDPDRSDTQESTNRSWWPLCACSVRPTLREDFAAVLAEADMTSVDVSNGVSNDVLEVDSAPGTLKSWRSSRRVAVKVASRAAAHSPSVLASPHTWLEVRPSSRSAVRNGWPP
jgi:hypothetical protein